MTSKLKILIVCEHASNVFGGEAMLPLNYFRFLSKTEHEVYLITHARVKPSIEQVEDINQSHVYYLPDTLAHRLLHKYSSLLPERISSVTFGFLMHLITQIYQWKLSRKVIKEKKIDLVHEPAPVSAIQPSAMFALGVPVVIGPMNGGMSFPDAFQWMAGKIERLIYKGMRIFTSLYNLLIPGKFFADVLLVANQRTQDALPKFRLGKVIELVENGVFSIAENTKNYLKTDQLNVIFVGRLVDWKAVDIAIEAVAKCNSNVKLTILGDGLMRPYLEAYSEEHAAGKVEFLGAVPHTETNQHYDEADVLVLPSLRECGGAVVLEAMARGLPVIATDWGGPADYITAETGYLVKPHSREYMVEQFSEILHELAISPEQRQKIGSAAKQRIKEYFLWDSKINQVVEIYQTLLRESV